MLTNHWRNTVSGLIMLAAVVGRAETFLGSDGQTNSIVIASNEAIILDFVFVKSGDLTIAYPTYSRTGEFTRVSARKGSAFVGPAELVLTQAVIFTFHRLQSRAIETVVLEAGRTQTLEVATNQTMKFFATEAIGPNQVTVARGSNSCRISDDYSVMRHGFEISGPLTVTLHGNTSEDIKQLFSYYLTEDFIQITADGYLKGPPGTYEVLVEKSTDLAQWLPVMVQSTATADTRAFYRLRIQK